MFFDYLQCHERVHRFRWRKRKKIRKSILEKPCAMLHLVRDQIYKTRGCRHEAENKFQSAPTGGGVVALFHKNKMHMPIINQRTWSHFANLNLCFFREKWHRTNCFRKHYPENTTSSAFAMSANTRITDWNDIKKILASQRKQKNPSVPLPNISILVL